MYKNKSMKGEFYQMTFGHIFGALAYYQIWGIFLLFNVINLENNIT